ncbi:MAG: hypothetical protein JWN14_799 [Chthonomonadales bacterium]|nr:hypothetical protein [Chthonomonadales bacterium]
MGKSPPLSAKWICEYCNRPQWGEGPIYGVSLCFLCIPEVAQLQDRRHYHACRAHELQIENAHLKREEVRLKNSLDEVKRDFRKWHTVAIAGMAAMRYVQGMLIKEAPHLVEPFREILLLENRITPMFRFVEAAVAVGRLNIDRADSIRPMTNGAVDAYHRLETAMLVADLAEVEETEYTQRVRSTVFKTKALR